MVTADKIERIFNRPEAGRPWRRAVIVRDPIDRFVSAYMSKCARCRYLPGKPSPKGDGCYNCNSAMGLSRTRNWTMTEVALALAANGGSSKNDHWKPQATFCGGLGSSWRSYTDIVPFENLAAGVGAVLEGRFQSHTQRGLVTALLNSSSQVGLLHNKRATEGEASLDSDIARGSATHWSHHIYQEDVAMLDEISRCAPLVQGLHVHVK